MKPIALLALIFGYAVCQECGIQNTNGRRRSAVEGSPNLYIVGGWPAKPGEIPSQVFLQIQSGQGAMSCGGSLISPTCILTAAHCVFSCGRTAARASSVTAYLGALSVQPMEAREQITSRDIRPHPSYRACTNDMKNDIAIIRLPRPVQTEMTRDGYKSVGTMCLANTDRFQTAFVSGWGRISSHSEQPSDKLKIADMNYVNHRSCRFPVDNSQICVSHPRNSGCNGDSGGPLYTVENGRQYQVGIVSYGVQNCHPGNPSVFTSVKAFESWIRQTCGSM